MKKIFLMAAITMMAAVSVNVQNDHETKHEVAISYGAFSNSQIIDVFEEITGAMFGAKLENEKFFGPISAKCFYHFKPWLSVGAIMVYGANKQDVMSDNEKTAESKNGYFTLMPAVKFDYLPRSISACTPR